MLSSSLIILKVLLVLVPGVSAFLVVDHVATITNCNILNRQQQQQHHRHSHSHRHRHYLSRQRQRQQQQQQQQDGLSAIINDSGGTEKTNSEIITSNSSSLRTTTRTLQIILDRMIQYFESMVDPETNQFFLLSYPQRTQSPGESDDHYSYAYQHCPLRELGCTWDATTALEQVLQVQQHQQQIQSTTTSTTQRRRQLLRNVVLQTIETYGTLFVCADDTTKTKTMTMKNTDSNYINSDNNSNGIALHCDVLKEIPNIAHNGLLLLTLIGSERLFLKEDDNDNDGDNDLFDNSPNIIDELTRGILFMQRNDGAFRTHYFDNSDNGNDNDNDADDVYKGIEFFSGEAMTALMEVYSYYSIDVTTVIGIDEQTTTINRILPAMKRALRFYRTYYDEGRCNGSVDVNYTIWQVQAFSRHFLVLQQKQQQYYSNDENNNNDDEIIMNDAADYCLDMCNDIIRSPSWKMLSRGKSFYPNLSTIEIACGLDALVQGTRVAGAVAVAVTKIHHNQHDVSSSSSALPSSDNNNDYTRLLFMRNIDNAIDFLQWSQDRIPKDSTVGYGGLGYGGFVVMEQRLDVTGHALSAVSELLIFLQEEEQQHSR